MNPHLVGKILIGCGVAWTAAAVIAELTFPPSAHWPTGLAAALAATVGWCLVAGVFFSLRAAFSAAGRREELLCSRLDELAEATVRRVESVGTEIRQADALLGKAIEQLVAAFEGAGVAARASAGESATDSPGSASMRRAGQDPSGGAGAAGPSRRRSDDIQAAVIALQFRDMVGQKLGYAQAQLSDLEQAISSLCVGHDGSGADVAARLYESAQRLRVASTAGPVQQESMRAGEIELF